jgi:hypothetical protein
MDTPCSRLRNRIQNLGKKNEGKLPAGRCRRKLEDNIKIGLKDIG